MPRTVWIVSSGRTGTQFLARYFDENFEAVTARHEPSPRMRTRIVANAYAQCACSRDRVVALLEKKKQRIDALAVDLYVESNPFLWGATGVLEEVFERPVVVHVIRDPREQIRSSLNHGTSTGFKAIANRWLPYWYPSTPQDSGDWMERATGAWAAVNRFVRDAGASCSNYTPLRYEDLFDETHSGLRSLCESLGVEFRGAGAPVDPARRINRAAGRVLGGWLEWSDSQCAAVHRIAAPLMAQYGYGTEPEWLARVEDGS
ncbi:MAG: sulfotransferase [Myxococcota bacterium]|nr:sulfotransferase [Myxococcota bacterium]